MDAHYAQLSNVAFALVLRRCLSLLFRRRSGPAQQGLEVVDLVGCQIGPDVALAATEQVVLERSMLVGQVLGFDRLDLVRGAIAEHREESRKVHMAHQPLALEEAAVVVRVILHLNLTLVDRFDKPVTRIEGVEEEVESDGGLGPAGPGASAVPRLSVSAWPSSG